MMMAAEHSITEPEKVAMESLFVPCTRYWDSYLARAEDHCDPEDSDDVYNHDFEGPNIRDEVELTAHGAQEGVLANGTWSWAELYSFIDGKIVWFSPEVYIAGTDAGRPVDDIGFNRVLEVAMEFDRTSGVTVRNRFRIFAASLAQTLIGCDRVLEYLSSAFGGSKLSFAPCTRQAGAGQNHTFPVSGPGLSRFLSQSHGARRLRLKLLELDTGQCQSIAATESIDGLEVELQYCQPTDEGASALVEGVRHSRGPSAFVYCKNIDDSLLVEALVGNTSVKKLACVLDARGVQALADNLALVELCFLGSALTDEIFSAMGESLSTHPALEKLDLCRTLPSPDNSSYDSDEDDGSGGERTIDFEQQKTSRTNVLVDMLRSNKKITSIDLTRDEFDVSVIDKEVYPRLKLNEYRVRFRAVKRIEGTLREPLLGRALDAVAHNASLLFLLFSGSTDIDWAALRRTRRSRKRVRYTK